MFYLCVYIWMTQKGRLEVGEGMNIDDSSCMLGLGKSGWVGGGQNGACHSNVRHLFSQWGRRDNAGDSWWQRQLVVPLAPACDPVWGDTSPKKKRKGNSGKKKKKTSLTNQNSRPDALPAPTGDQCHEDARLAHLTMPSLSQRPTTPLLPPSICPSSTLHPPALGHWGLSAKPSNLSALSFLPPQIWIWKGTLSYPVKDHHFNDIWQSFDLLGFRGREEEIH